MFTKLFSSITTSSIWNEDNNTRIVWITMLAMSNKLGYVSASIGGLAHEARVTREECEKALDVLKSPDNDSRSKEFDGRRIEIVDGGFQLLNHQKYRAMRSEEERKEYMKSYMRDYRARTKNVNKNVKNVSECKPPLAQAEADADADNNTLGSFKFPESLKSKTFVKIWTEWTVYRKKIKHSKDWKGLFQKQLDFLGRFQEDIAIEIISQTMRNGWQGLFEPRAPFQKNGSHPISIPTINSVAQMDSVIKEIGHQMDVIRDSSANKFRTDRGTFELKPEAIESLNKLKKRKNELLAKKAELE